MTNIQTKTKQQDIKHQIIDNKKKQQAMEEPKYSGSEQKGKNDKTYNFRNTSTRAKLETKNREKEDKIDSELPQDKNSDMSNRDVCPLCIRPAKTGVECGICSRWFHYKSEGTTEERVLKESPRETQYICIKDKEQKQLEVAIRDLRKQLQ